MVFLVVLITLIVQEPKGDYLVKMRGLPFEAGPREVERFFEGLPVMERGILVCKDATGRPSGEAYCEFPTEALVTEAVKRDNTNMGHRWEGGQL